jgi:hypothetical protein
MTNKEIEKYKNELSDILKELWYEKGTKLGPHVQKLAKGIKKLQTLTEIVDSRKYIGTGLRDIDFILEQNEEKVEKIEYMIQKSETYEAICKEISDNIIYKLQTEMMLNACVSAKWSCFFAFLATIVALISIILTWYLN